MVPLNRQILMEWGVGGMEMRVKVWTSDGEKNKDKQIPTFTDWEELTEQWKVSKRKKSQLT